MLIIIGPAEIVHEHRVMAFCTRPGAEEELCAKRCNRLFHRNSRIARRKKKKERNNNVDAGAAPPSPNDGRGRFGSGGPSGGRATRG